MYVVNDHLCVHLIVCRMLFVVQNVIASHESNGLDIIIALLLSDINPLRKQRIDLVLGLKVSSQSHSLQLRRE